MPKELNSKQVKFIDAYVSGADAAHAVLAAGYQCNQKASTVQAVKLLRMPHIKSEIERRQKLLSDKVDVKREEILIGLKTIFESAEHNKDRIAAAAQINKMQGFYATEKLKVEHTGQVSVVVELPNNNRKSK